jgi:hypothetical protein
MMTPTDPVDIPPPPRPDSARARSSCERNPDQGGQTHSLDGMEPLVAERCRAAFPERRRQSGEGEQLRLHYPCSGMEAPTGRNYMDAATVGMLGDGKVRCCRCREGRGGGGGAGTRNPRGREASGGWGSGWAMTWMAERPENGTKNKVLYDSLVGKQKWIDNHPKQSVEQCVHN